ncbi:MAG: maleylpyruvate isomerase N-terminal domain-containing protein [Chloroflexi bacterium]|nr:maleylpyruvate isomerase N-terminal domain-containing protein [Chloroflexota bacterium]
MSGQDIRETYLEAGEYFAGVVDQVDIDGWDEPALGEWCARDLTGHTYRAFTTILSYSDKPAEKVELERPVDYFLKALESLADPKQVAERGRAAGLEIIDNPTMMVRGFAMYVKNKLEELSDDHIMGTPVGGIRLIDYLPTRTFELIIHTMDLAKSIGVEAEPPERGMEATVRLLGQIALYRGQAPSLVLAATGRNGLPDGFSVLG